MKHKETKIQEVQVEKSAKLQGAIKLLEEKVMREFGLTNLIDKTLTIKDGELSIK